MNTILVPTDFSKTSRNAIEYAAEMAKHSKSKLLLMHVYAVPISPMEAPSIMPLWDTLEKDSLSQLEKIVRSVHRRHGKSLKVEIIARMGSAVDEILNTYSKEKGIGAVVMGMHGAGYLSEKLLGSTTTALIKQSNCPVIVINESIQFKIPKKIVLACDYTKIPSASVLNPLIELTKMYKSEILVLKVETEKSETTPVKRVAAAIDHNLQGTKHSFHFVSNTDTVDGINSFVSSKKADLLVLIPHKHKFLSSIFHRSNTKRMAFHTSTPLLTLAE